MKLIESFCWTMYGCHSETAGDKKKGERRAMNTEAVAIFVNLLLILATLCIELKLVGPYLNGVKITEDLALL